MCGEKDLRKRRLSFERGVERGGDVEIVVEYVGRSQGVPVNADGGSLSNSPGLENVRHVAQSDQSAANGR